MTAHEVSFSSSSKSKIWNYDVYLSFRGEDTRYGFTGHLVAALRDRGYHAFVDEDDLIRGEEITEQIFRAIEESRISIIVFSKSYADSRWCLDELVKIMECREKLGRHVLPIFYHVDPSHVKKQKGVLAYAFQNYEEGIREEKDDKEREAKQERVEQWKNALSQAANLSGHYLQITDNRHEAKFIKKIVDENISEWLPRTKEVSFSSSPKSELWNYYDVYLSCGVDTRYGFTGHLVAALQDRGYHAYMVEDDLIRAEKIKEEMFRAIEEPRISIIVFSNSYADSRWCLDELVKIMECREKLGQHVLPIFYHVDPSHVRKQKGVLAYAFQKHEEGIREEKDYKEREAKRERVEQWKNALSQAANLFGHYLQITDNRHEAKFIKKIVDENISEWFPRTKEVSFSSSKSKLWNYDVYLSFSGVDTRYGFTGHLVAALQDRGYHAYMDKDDLIRGEKIKEEMFRAIEESRISIIVFSKSYADSSWCLDELVKIMECREKLGRHVLPIFYYVDISHVRKQNGDLAQAFQKHEEGIREEKDDKEREAKQERVKQWRTALAEAANLSGHHFQITDPGSEAMLVREMVDKIITKGLLSEDKLHVAEHQVGIDSRIEDIITYLSSGGSDDVLMVGIWGMGGLGKTTVAKAIYNQIHHKFQFKSFLADVSDTTSKYGLVNLQETLVSDILNQNKSQMIWSVDGGISLIKQQFRHRRVLVIMDNIDEVEQLNAIAGNHEWFGLGSRIIITTRDENLLKEVKVDKIYPLQEMNEVEALELFSWHAFGNRWPNEEYLKLSEKIVSYCRGVPLALEVLGSFLFKRSIAEWESKLEKLKRTPDEKIMKGLRISFEGLDDMQKAIFLDISCFFIGWDKDYVAKVLDGCGFFATFEIRVLRERGLVTVERNELNMHDLVRELARVIISEKSPGHPGKWSRLWNPPEVIDVLKNKSGTEEVEGLTLDFPAPCLSSSKTPEVIDVLTNKSGTEEVEQGTEEVEGLALDFPDPCLSSSNNAIFSTEAFANMKKLRLLHLKNVQLNGNYKHLPKELIWLCWRGFSSHFIPDDFFNQPRLVVLDMQSSNLVQVWKGSKSLQNLKIIDLSDSIYLIESPDFSQVPNLEELILEGCERLSAIHISIGHLKRLSLVNLRNCRSLRSLPRDFYRSKSVEILCLNGCSTLRELHEDLGEMVSLRILEAENTSIKRVPASIARLKKLTRFSLRFGNTLPFGDEQPGM